MGSSTSLLEPLVRLGARIVFHGDSVTWYGGFPEGWCRLVEARLMAIGRDVAGFCSGFSGDNSTQMVARFASEALCYGPDWVTIMAGINDVYDGVPVATYKANLAAMITAAEARKCRVLLMTPNLVEPPHNPSFNETMAAYVTACRELAGAHPAVVLADVHAAHLASGETWTFDGAHPNELGHQRIAATVLQAFGLEA